MSALVIRLPMPPNLANSRMHWRVKNKHRKEYFGACDVRSMCNLLPDPPRVPLPTATLTSRMTLRSPMDHDNAVARHKWAVDWLVSRGYLAGDSRKHLTWTAFPSQKVSRSVEPELELTILPLSFRPEDEGRAIKGRE